MFISDFKTDQEISMFLLLDNVIRGIATSGKPYLTLYLKDKTGSIDGKIWEVKDEDSENLKAGKMVYVEGTILDYRGKLQLKIKNYRMATENDNIDIQDYIQTAPVPKDVMINELNYFLKEISNENLRTVTIELLNKYKKQFWATSHLRGVGWYFGDCWGIARFSVGQAHVHPLMFLRQVFLRRAVAQLVAHRSPKPAVVGSSPACPADKADIFAGGFQWPQKKPRTSNPRAEIVPSLAQRVSVVTPTGSRPRSPASSLASSSSSSRSSTR